MCGRVAMDVLAARGAEFSGLVSCSVETHKRNHVLYRWPDKDEEAKRICALGRR
jgi:hypothetical protein